MSSPVEPTVVACGAVGSRMRVLDIRDVEHPLEVACGNVVNDKSWAYDFLAGNADQTAPGTVYSGPAFDPVNNDIWYPTDCVVSTRFT